MLISGQNKAADLSSLLMIHSVATAFKSLLRPSDLITHDKGPAESLAAVLTDVITDNIDKVIQSIYFELSINVLFFLCYKKPESLWSIFTLDYRHSDFFSKSLIINDGSFS